MSDPTTNSALQLSPQEMRSIGYRVVDMLVDHVAGLRDRPVTRRATRASLEERLREPLPETGLDAEEVLAHVQDDVLGNIIHVDHPRFFAFVPGPGNFVGAMADALAAGVNVFAGTWLEAAGPAQVELVTADWLRQLCGLPDSARGLFVSGGSMANLTCLAVARHVRLGDRTAGAITYCSDQTHSSVERALRVLGFQPHQVRKLASDAGFRLALPELRAAVEADRARGDVPFCVIASAGTTNTGAVDPLPELADFCREQGLWLHVDGAYGAAAVLCEQGRETLRGLDRVDSLSLDPHKWLFQPYEIGCALVRDGVRLRETFQLLPEYLKDLEGEEDEVNFCDYGIQLTRGFRALKLWMSIKVFGLNAFREAVGRGFQLAEAAERRLRTSGRWEVVTPAQMGIVTFRYGASPHATDDLNRQLAEAMMAGGFAMLSTTVLRGRTVLRLCTINPRTSEADVTETIRRLEQLGSSLERYQQNP